jgi:hypothetical protein
MMQEFSENSFFALSNTICVHESLIDGKNDRYHAFLCKQLAVLYAEKYPEMFVGKTPNANISIAENLQLVDFQQNVLAYSLLFALAKLPEKEIFYCLTPITWLDTQTVVKKIILQNFELLQVITSWQNPAFYADFSQRIVLKIRKLKHSLLVCEDTNKGKKHSLLVCGDTNKGKKIVCEDTNKGKKAKPQNVFFVNLQADSNLSFAELFSNIKMPALTSFEKVNDNIAFFENENFTIWAASSEVLLKNSLKDNWAKFLKMSGLYGDLQTKCKYMFTPFKNIANIQAGFLPLSPLFYPLIKIEGNDKQAKVLNVAEEEVQIEHTHLRNVLVNGHELDLLAQSAEPVGAFAFCCQKNKEDLQKNSPLALAYIAKAEEMIKLQSPDKELVANWYQTKIIVSDALFDSKMPTSFCWAENKDGYLHTGSLLGISWKKAALKYFFRSSLWQFIVENENAIFSNEGFVLSAAKLADLPVIQTELIANEACKQAYDTLAQRPQLPLHEEIEQEDTQVLDRLIWEALGLEAENLPNLYAAIQKQYFQRIHIQEVKKKHKTPKEFIKLFKNYMNFYATNTKNLVAESSFYGENQAKEQKMADLQEQDFAVFAKQFATKNAKSYDIANKKIKISSFLGKYEVYANENLLFATDSEATTNYVRLYVKTEAKTLEVPEKEAEIIEILTTFNRQKRSVQQKKLAFATQKLQNSWLVERLLKE